MRPSRHSRQVVRRTSAVVVGLLLAALLVGCGDDAAPAEKAPALSTSLDEVDAAVEEGDEGQVRRAVRALIAETAQALVEDRITDEEADEIFEAARDLLAELPDEASSAQ